MCWDSESCFSGQLQCQPLEILCPHTTAGFTLVMNVCSCPFLIYLTQQLLALGRKKLPDLCMRVLSSRQFSIKVNNYSDKKLMTITEFECLNIKYMCLFLSHLIHYQKSRVKQGKLREVLVYLCSALARIWSGVLRHTGMMQKATQMNLRLTFQCESDWALDTGCPEWLCPWRYTEGDWAWSQATCSSCLYFGNFQRSLLASSVIL